MLTFHSDVNTVRDCSVLNFVKQDEFIKRFKYILEKEFSEKIEKYGSSTINMVALHADICKNDRQKLLKKFDKNNRNDIFIVSSCETIGEGVNTKNANMCVFVDPKTSYTKIIQNIGRIVRPSHGLATIVLPCFIDKTKYVECEGDRSKIDECIREEMKTDNGDFQPILNVLSALKQEDEELYEQCLYYPNIFSKDEHKQNLDKYGYNIVEDTDKGNTVIE